MPDLNDFIDAPQFSLDDFKPDNQKPPSYINEATAKNAAGHAVALAGPQTDLLNTYDTVNGQLATDNVSPLFEQIKQNVAAGDIEAAKQTIPGMLEDPTIPDDVKKHGVVESLDPTSDAYSPQNMVSRRALTTPLTGETPEQEAARLSIAATLRAINAVKAQKQALYNQFVAKNDPSIGSKVGAVLGGLIPLTTGGQTQELVGKAIPDASWWDRAESFFLTGSGKQKVIDYLNSLPLDQQVAAYQHVLDITKSTTGILPGTGNNFKMVQDAATFLQDGSYTLPEKAMDNLTSLLDVVAVGGLVGKGVKVAAEAGRASKLASEGEAFTNLYGDVGKPPSGSGGAGEAFRDNAGRDFVRSSVQPSSVAENLKDTNPQQLRLVHNIVADDPTDEAAQALYGTTRNEAIAHDHAPEVAHVDGSVNAKVSEPDFSPENALDPDIADFVNKDGFTALENSEKAKTRARIVNNFADALTATPRTEMWTLGGITSEDTPEGVKIQAIYGPSGTGYADPDEARELFKWGHRNWGVTDDNITILERQGGIYRTYTPKEGGIQNNASGESAASVEAINRNAAEQDSGQFRFLIDRNDDITPLIGVDAVDQVARPGQMIVQRGVGENEWTVLSNGDDLSKDVVQGKLNRNLTKLNAATQERLKETASRRAGDYLVQIDFNYRFRPGDIEDWYNTTTKRNFFDMLSPITEGTHGSLTQHIFPSTSVLDNVMSLSALNTSDKAAGLEKLILQPLKSFSKATKGLSKDRYAKILSKIQDANLRGYTPTYTNMKAEGFSENEIQAMQTWRKFWDNIWHLENADHNKSARARGHMIFTDAQNKTHLEVKPIRRRGDITGSVDIANPMTGEFKTLSPKDIDFIYERGGLLAQLDTPIKIGDDFATHVISMETPDSYLRVLNDSDASLHYRPGYYNVSYKGPYFIDRIWKDRSGNIKHKTTVYSADNRKDADMVASRLDKSVDDGSYHVVRLDKKLSNREQNTWELQKAAGRSAQRFRGERLIDATSNVQGPEHGHILNPIEAAVRSARSISRRASMRDWLDVTKSRYINNNSAYLPRNQFGKPVFPAKKSDIAIQTGEKGTKKGLAKARTEFDYIRSMENGFVNSIDDFWKASLNSIADILGEKHLTLAEKSVRVASSTALTAEAKKLSFGLFLALNPVRQLLVQGHQGVLLAAINPGWFVTRAAPQLAYLMARQVGMDESTIPDVFFKSLGMTRKQADQMFKDLEHSGLAAGVDKHSIVRGSLNDMADMMIQNSGRSVASKVTKPIKAIGHYSRVVGFDAGEWFNIVSSWAAHRDKALKAGLDISRSDVQANIAARARNFTGSMNAAGDMPYNANELNMLMQFQQQAHKMFSLMTTNRVLSRAERLRLLAFTTIMWGIPATIGAVIWRGISSDKDSVTKAKEKAHAIELIQRGAESAILNRTASAISGDKVDVDFSSLNPLNMYGTAQLAHSLFTQTPGEVLANTPTGSLFFGGNPRLTKFVKTTAQYFHLMDDNDNPVTFAQEAKDFANMSSGFSNAFQAAYALKYHQAISSYSGAVTDPNVSSAEAIAKFFGFSTWASVQKAAENQDMYEASVDYENDVNKWYKQFRADMQREGMSADELDYIKRVHNKAFLVFGNNPRASRIIESNLLKDAAKGDLTFYKRATDSLGVMNYQDWRKMVLNTSQISDETKQQILTIGELFHNSPEGKE